MTEELQSIWTMDREAIEETLRMGRSPRRVYTPRDYIAIRAVLARPDFEHLDQYGREKVFEAASGEPTDVAPPSPPAPNPVLLVVGWFLLLGSLALCVFAYFGYETAVHSDADSTGTSFIPARDIINNGLLQNQLMLFLAGLASAVSSVTMLLAHAIVAAIRSPKTNA